MHAEVTITTHAFEHRTIQPHFINPCCFGEDLAIWLRGCITSLSSDGFTISEPIQEDYGWGLWATIQGDPFWIAISFAGEGPTDNPGEWTISVDYDPGLNIFKRFLHKPDKKTFEQLRNSIWNAIKTHPELMVSEQ